MADRSAVTVRPLLSGFVPGVTVTLRFDGSPGRTPAGSAAPTPDGEVGPSSSMHSDALFCGLLGVSSAKSVALSSVST